MTIYYVSSHETYVRDYKVEADSVDEAVKAVKDGLVDHFDETHYQSCLLYTSPSPRDS